MNKTYKPIPQLTERQIKNFWAKVDKSGNCWLWTGAFRAKSYGAVQICPYVFTASRISYFINYQIDPSDKFVCHTCDNPQCVNPKHLFLGNHVDNFRDAYKKQRASVGSRSPNSKLDERKVKEIRARYQNGETFTTLAIEFGVCRQSLTNAVQGKTWKHV